MAGRRDVQQIEQTGKSYKAGMLIGWVLFFIGFVVAVGADGIVGTIMMVLGISIVISSKFMGWWDHG